jgi:hypothetical protein
MLHLKIETAWAFVLQSWGYLQLAILISHCCRSSGYNFKSIGQAKVRDILKKCRVNSSYCQGKRFIYTVVTVRSLTSSSLRLLRIKKFVYHSSFYFHFYDFFWTKYNCLGNLCNMSRPNVEMWIIKKQVDCNVQV